MESNASTHAASLETRVRRVVAELKSLVDSDQEHSFVVERAVKQFSKLADRSDHVALKLYSDWLSPLGESLRSSICRQLEVEGYLQQQPWFPSVVPTAKWPKTGERVGSFHLLEQIGRGACSRVYLCRQAGIGDRHVVVKFTDGCPFEADVLGRLRHSNIVPIYSATEDRSGISSLCMPFLGRSTLVDYIEDAECATLLPSESLIHSATRRKQPTDGILGDSLLPAVPKFYSRSECVTWLGWRIALALAHAHGQGIVHGDVKPSNILLAWDGNPMLMDFNLSGSLSHAIEARGGTLPYMPPEQLQSFGHECYDAVYDQRSDLFSLGVVLYEALTGRLPFPISSGGDDRASLAVQLLSRQRAGATPVRSIDKTIPSNLASAVESCLRFDPERRLPSAQALSDALGAEFGLVRRASRVANRHRVLVVGVAAAFIISVGTFSMAAILRPPEFQRLYLQGKEQFDRGEYSVSLLAFDRSLTLNADQNETRFALGTALLRSGEISRAQSCFQELYRREKSARASGYVGYCMSLKGEMTDAIAWYARSLDYDDESPEIHNNLAVAYESGRSRLGHIEQLTVAMEHLRRSRSALGDNPTIVANQIRLQLRLAESTSSLVPKETAELAKWLVRECPDQKSVQLDAARVFIQHSSADPSGLDAGAECLRRAIELGYRISPSSAEWRSLHSTKQWAEILAASQ
jgi:tetratricopeptide (TPR) repeat protein